MYQLDKEAYLAKAQEAAAMGKYDRGYTAGGAIGAGAGMLETCESRQRELPEQIDKMAKALEFTEHGLSMLVERLEGVLRPQPPQPMNSGNQLSAVGPSTGIGMTLSGFSSRVSSQGERIQDLLRRLEV